MLKDVPAMRVVAFGAIHAGFKNRVMLRQVEFSVGLKMTLKTRGGVFAGVDDEFSTPAACLDMFAARPMTGFATGLP